MENQASMENQDRTSVEKVLTRYFNSLNESDVKTAVNSYTADGVFMAAGAPTALGSDQLVTAYESLFKVIQLRVNVTIDEVILKDDLCFVRTHSTGSTLIRATGETVPAQNREFFLLRKEEGEWQIARYLFNQPK